jgi:restriction system protein
MAIPDYQTFLLPLLKLAADNQIHSIREAYQILPEHFDLTEEEKRMLLPSGQQPVVNNRIGWARTYLKKANLITQPKRGYFQITERGKSVLLQNLNAINLDFLTQFPEFQEFRAKKSIADETNIETQDPLPLIKEKNPEEILEYAYEEINNEISQELLETVKAVSPTFFEKLVIDLLLKMGYGGSRKDAGQAIGRSGDEGIDGIIKEDRLGLDVIYIQAKRWDNVVGRPEVQKFAGALQGQRAKKGIFITTSSFTKEALAFASNIDNKIILIDGESLTKFMIEHNVGISTASVYEIKKIDSDYFEE